MTTILIDSTHNAYGRACLFESPTDIVKATRPKDVSSALAALRSHVENGRYAAGFLSYELGYCLEPKLTERLPQNLKTPLLWFGIFEECQHLSKEQVDVFLVSQSRTEAGYSFSKFELSWSREAYKEAFAKVKDHISRGDIYQLNLTFGADFQFTGNIHSLYQDLKLKQGMEHGALIHTPDFSVVSASPELFLSLDGRQARTGPMKGTHKRGLTREQDLSYIDHLQEDLKSQAENLMIVDLMRNDLGRISEVGSVQVTDLFQIETYPTLHQMTSYVESRLREDVDLNGWLRGLFPPGSITGAPKVRAMEIIRDLEPDERGIYTGAIGMITPKGELEAQTYFNVAIRTLNIQADGKGRMGIGSGLVSDSNADDEYDECVLKMKFLTDPAIEFQLIETFAYSPEQGLHYYPYHLERLKNSAEYFDFSHDREKVETALQSEVAKLENSYYRVRLLLSKDGSVSVASTAIETPDPNAPMRFVVSEKRMSRDNVFLYHKTTNRAFYDDEHKAKSEAHGCDEVLFLNEQGEITEGSRTNFFLEKDGLLYTPALSSGLLAGTMRAALLEEGRVQERVLTLDDMKSADRIYLGNSVRGLLIAEQISIA